MPSPSHLLDFPGLTSQEVEDRFNGGKQNTTDARPSRTYLQLILANVFSPYNLILFFAVGFLIVAQGAIHVLPAIALLAVNSIVGLFQEVRAKFALDKLASLLPKNVSVHRDGEKKSIPSTQIVQDDIIELFPGDQVFVDGTILYSEGFELDESSLTGESEYMLKKIGDYILSGSFAVAGFAVMKAEKIGDESYMHKFMQKAREYKESLTPLDRRLRFLFRLLLIGLLILGPLTFISGLNNFAQTFSESLENFVNLFSSVIPQGLIASITLLYAYGAVKMSRYQALIQRVNSIGLMGHINVICIDKTGTITTNKLVLEEVVSLSLLPQLEVEKKLSLYASVITTPNKTLSAIAQTMPSLSVLPEKIGEIAFNSQRKWGAVSFEHEGTFVLGAPEKLVTDTQTLHDVKKYTQKGLRVLAFMATPEKIVSGRTELPGGLKILAFVILKDELRSDITETMNAFARLKMKVKVISGDNSETVHTIAQRAGIEVSEPMTQSQLEACSKSEFDRAVKLHNLFCRIDPNMKARIIASLSKQGFQVAMVGDGVNDVPALKKAKVSIAMNEGAQIAKDVSDIILLNNAFSVLPKAIAEGRDIAQRIYAIAKIFFIKVIYLVIVVVLTGMAALPFPINLAQTTWIGFILVGAPTLLIATKVLSPISYKTDFKYLANFCLSIGMIGGITMTVLDVVATVFLHEDITDTRTILTIFACVFSTLVLWKLHDVQFLKPKTFFKNAKSNVIILLIGMLSIAIPYLLPEQAGIYTGLILQDWISISVGIIISIVLLEFSHTFTVKKFMQLLDSD